MENPTISLVILGLMGFTALFVALFMMPLVRRLSFVIGAIDHPTERKVHAHPVPRLGGMAIIVGFLASLLLFLPMDQRLAAFLAGTLIVIATGFLDDVYKIRPAYKFLGEIIATSLFIAISGAALYNFGDLIGIGDLETGAFAPFITVFCMVGVINALNLSDGLDGLAGGISGIACLFLVLFAFKYGYGFCLAIGIALFASILGFLRYNTFPATVFMGDVGSLFLGYSLIAISILLVQESQSLSSIPPISTALILAVPIVDTLMVMTRRIWHRQNPFSPDKTHLHHRLLTLGLPHPAVVGIIYSLMTGFGVLAWTIHDWPEKQQFAVGIVLVLVIYGSVILLNRMKWRFSSISVADQERSFRQTRLFRGITRIVGHVTPYFGMFLGCALLLPAIWPAYGLTKTEGLAALAVSVFIALLFPWFERRDRVSGWMHGLLYAAAFTLLAAFHLAPHVPAWLPGYFSMLSVVLTVFVFLKVLFRSHHEIFLTSSFELLMIIISWMIPLFVIPELGFGEEVSNTLYIVCLESIPVLLAMKILIRKQPRRNFLLAGSVTATLLIMGIRGMTGL